MFDSFDQIIYNLYKYEMSTDVDAAAVEPLIRLFIY